MFKNFAAVEMGLLHSHPFKNSHFHFFIIVELATSQVFLQRSKQMEVQWGKDRTKGGCSRISQQNNATTLVSDMHCVHPKERPRMDSKK
jgi:hypothetical protein